MSEAKVFNKRILVAISHAIEQFALASEDTPMVVVSMFQRLTYFEREVEVYRRIAQKAALVQVGVAEEFPPRLPDGVTHVRLLPGEDLSRVWSVTVLSPKSGATLRCTDLETLEPHSPTLEAGRRFFGGWSFRRHDAYAEIVRMRQELIGRTPPEQVDTMDAVLADVLKQPGSAAEGRVDAAMHMFARFAEGASRQRDLLAYRVDSAECRERDQRTGLRNAEFVERFTAGAGAGTLPVALLLLRIRGLGRLKASFGFRAEMAALLGIARVLSGPLTEVDHAVRLGEEEFLLMMPSRRRAEVEAVQEAVARAIDDLSTVYPYAPLPSTSVLTVTRNRPLPLPDMYDALQRAERHGQPIVALKSA